MLVKVNTGLSGTSRFRYKRLNLGKKNKAGDGNRIILRCKKSSKERSLRGYGFPLYRQCTSLELIFFERKVITQSNTNKKL